MKSFLGFCNHLCLNHRCVSNLDNNTAFFFISAQSTDLLEDCQKLLERFKYPWEMMPLMYAILKDARADLEEASRRIDEGECQKKDHQTQTYVFILSYKNSITLLTIMQRSTCILVFFLCTVNLN